MKKIILILLFIIIPLTGAFALDLPKNEDLLPDKIAQINSIQNDEQKVKAWAKLSSSQNYVIIDKKDCLATIYDKHGMEIKSFEVGIGKEIGDDYNDAKGLVGKIIYTTPAGEYTLNSNITKKAEYGDLTLSLGKTPSKSPDVKKVVAMHKVPTSYLTRRNDKFYDGDIENNRMSKGCINFLAKDFNELTKYIKAGAKTYVLPEEDDNQLILTKNDNGEFELAQTKYKR